MEADVNMMGHTSELSENEKKSVIYPKHKLEIADRQALPFYDVKVPDSMDFIERVRMQKKYP